MTQAWVVLTGHDGHDIDMPTETQMAAVLAAVFGQLTKGERATATLRFGYDDGLMYAAEVTSDGQLRFEEWSDRDCELALAQPRLMKASEKEAKMLWSLMAKRQVSKIRDLAWHSGG